VRTDILTETQLDVLERLTPLPVVHEFYLAGGTDRYHRLRVLAYFDDAEQEPMPNMLVPFDWNEAKRFFTREAARLLAASNP
jgi:hypothetical protein